MKKVSIIMGSFIFSSVCFTSWLDVQAQGITYVSNLDQQPASHLDIGSDSWLALNFRTGNNVEGYVLNYIQLGMTGISGSPGSFNVMLYDGTTYAGGAYNGNYIATLSGSDPTGAGVFTYTSEANLALLPDTHYYIVLTAATPISTGSYELNFASTWSYSSIDGWGQANGYCHSSTGSSWMGSLGYPQYSVNATAVPEPTTLILIALGGLPWAWRRLCRGC